MCGSMVDIQSPSAEIRREKEEETTGWKYIWPALLHRAAIKKLNWVTPNGGTKCRWGRLNAGVVAENWWLSTWSFNLALLQVYHAECPPYLFAARLPWCRVLAGLSATANPCYWMLDACIMPNREYQSNDGNSFPCFNRKAIFLAVWL